MDLSPSPKKQKILITFPTVHGNCGTYINLPLCSVELNENLWSREKNVSRTWNTYEPVQRVELLVKKKNP